MDEKIETAIKRLQTASDMSLKIYKQPLIITTSGGKDSSVCVELAQMAKIPFEVQHNHTTADAPETVYFVRSEFQRLELGGVKCTINYPYYKGERTSMWDLIPKKLMPPTRLARYCCDVLKENGGKNRFITTGVRWEESTKRKEVAVYEIFQKNEKNRLKLNNDNDEKRMLFETCQLRAKRIVNPIVDWAEKDVWDFLNDSKVPVNPLYTEGFCRVGCVGCPMAGKRGREREFLRWPKYKKMYINAFNKMLELREERGRKTSWLNGQDVFNWWLDYDVLPGQMNFDELVEEQEED